MAKLTDADVVDSVDRRGYAQFGFAYVTSGRKLVRAAPMPEFLRELAERGRASCAAGSARFDPCIVTRYPAGAGIGWHTDAPCFGDWVMALSLGRAADRLLRANGSEVVVHRQTVAPGSLYCLHGAARWDYQHAVEAVAGERFSVTYRHTVPATPGA